MGCVYGLNVQKWAVYMGYMCCSSGLKSGLKLVMNLGCNMLKWACENG